MFKVFEELTKAVVNTAVLPVKVAADVVTGGGLATERDETYTGEQVRKIVKNLDDATRDEDK
jgi:hypothetical protein